MQLQNKKISKRVWYAIVTLVLLVVEVLIALYVRDAFVRPYVGDVLVVVVLYTAIRTVIEDRCRLLPLVVFLFATGVEVLQYLRIVERLGLSDNKFFSILIGSTFDWKDILCYGVGCACLGAYELWNRKRKEVGA